MESVFWSDGVAGLHPYVPGEQPQIANLVKLNTNENPFPPSEQVLAAIAAAAQSDLQRYPDPQSADLLQALRTIGVGDRVHRALPALGGPAVPRAT